MTTVTGRSGSAAACNVLFKDPVCRIAGEGQLNQTGQNQTEGDQIGNTVWNLETSNAGMTTGSEMTPISRTAMIESIQGPELMMPA